MKGMTWMHKHGLVLLSGLALLVATAGCSEDDATGTEGEGEHTGMTGATADCEFSILTVQVGQAPPVELDLNGLAVQELPGGQKNGEAVDVVTRRGVRLADLFQRGGLTADDAQPVNAVARDGFDPLRTQLKGDVAKLPTFGFVRTHGYVYVGSPGDKDPLYPQLEGRSLFVDYAVTEDAQVPAELGGNLPGLGKFRWKMMEKIDDQTRGVFQIDPTP